MSFLSTLFRTKKTARFSFSINVQSVDNLPVRNEAVFLECLRHKKSYRSRMAVAEDRRVVWHDEWLRFTCTLTMRDHRAPAGVADANGSADVSISRNSSFSKTSTATAVSAAVAEHKHSALFEDKFFTFVVQSDKSRKGSDNFVKLKSSINMSCFTANMGTNTVTQTFALDNKLPWDIDRNTKGKGQASDPKRPAAVLKITVLCQPLHGDDTVSNASSRRSSMDSLQPSGISAMESGSMDVSEQSVGDSDPSMSEKRRPSAATKTSANGILPSAAAESDPEMVVADMTEDDADFLRDRSETKMVKSILGLDDNGTRHRMDSSVSVGATYSLPQPSKPDNGAAVTPAAGSHVILREESSDEAFRLFGDGGGAGPLRREFSDAVVNPATVLQMSGGVSDRFGAASVHESHVNPAESMDSMASNGDGAPSDGLTPSAYLYSTATPSRGRGLLDISIEDVKSVNALLRPNVTVTPPAPESAGSHTRADSIPTPLTRGDVALTYSPVHGMRRDASVKSFFVSPAERRRRRSMPTDSLAITSVTMPAASRSVSASMANKNRRHSVNGPLVNIDVPQSTRGIGSFERRRDSASRDMDEVVQLLGVPNGSASRFSPNVTPQQTQRKTPQKKNVARETTTATEHGLNGSSMSHLTVDTNDAGAHGSANAANDAAISVQTLGDAAASPGAAVGSGPSLDAIRHLGQFIQHEHTLALDVAQTPTKESANPLSPIASVTSAEKDAQATRLWNGIPVCACMVMRCLLEWNALWRPELRWIATVVVDAYHDASRGAQHMDDLCFSLTDTVLLIHLLKVEAVAHATTPRAQLNAPSPTNAAGRQRQGRHTRHVSQTPVPSAERKDASDTVASWMEVELSSLALRVFRSLVRLALSSMQKVDFAEILKPTAPQSDMLFSLKKVTLVLKNTQQHLKRNHVMSAIRNQVLGRLFSFVEVKLFNELVVHPELAHTETGLQLNMVCSALDQWAYDAGGKELEELAKNWLARLRESALLLMVSPSTLRSLNDVKEMCPHLHVEQLEHLILSSMRNSSQGVVDNKNIKGAVPSDAILRDLRAAVSTAVSPANRGAASSQRSDTESDTDRDSMGPSSPAAVLRPHVLMDAYKEDPLDLNVQAGQFMLEMLPVPALLRYNEDASSAVAVPVEFAFLRLSDTDDEDSDDD